MPIKCASWRAAERSCCCCSCERGSARLIERLATSCQLPDILKLLPPTGGQRKQPTTPTTAAGSGRSGLLLFFAWQFFVISTTHLSLESMQQIFYSTHTRIHTYKHTYRSGTGIIYGHLARECQCTVNVIKLKKIKN